MKKVIVIAYAFPPTGGGGVQRPAKFVKYLSEFGWTPVVITVANPSVPIVDSELEKDIPASVKIYKARTFEPSYDSKRSCSSPSDGRAPSVKRLIKTLAQKVLLPDVQMLWWPGLILTLLRVIREENPDCIFVTAPPFSSFIPTVCVGKLMKIPVVIDFRDEWAFSRAQLENAVKTNLASRLDTLYERYSVMNCTSVTAANQSYINGILKSYPSVDAKKCQAITNGFDEDDFSPVEETKGETDKLNFVYAGTVWKATSLKAFLSALADLSAAELGILNEMELNVYGRVVDSELIYVDESIKPVVKINGYRGHKEIVSHILRADVLLLTLSDLPGADKIIAGKVFEYMATGRHILAIVPEGETRNILLDFYGKNSTIVDPDNINDIRVQIRNLLRNRSELGHSMPAAVSMFTRRHLTYELAKVFDAAIGKSVGRG